MSHFWATDKPSVASNNIASETSRMASSFRQEGAVANKAKAEPRVRVAAQCHPQEDDEGDDVEDETSSLSPAANNGLINKYQYHDYSEEREETPSLSIGCNSSKNGRPKNKTSAVEMRESNEKNSLSGGRKSNESASSSKRFPSKLHAILSTPRFSHIISWLPHGRSWKIWSVSLLEEVVLPQFFEFANYNSFLRLVNAWKFRRVKSKHKRDSPDYNSYYHELFLRTRSDLSIRMKRLPKKIRKLPMDKSAEPDFDKLPPLPCDKTDKPCKIMTDEPRGSQCGPLQQHNSQFLRCTDEGNLSALALEQKMEGEGKCMAAAVAMEEMEEQAKKEHEIYDHFVDSRHSLGGRGGLTRFLTRSEESSSIGHMREISIEAAPSNTNAMSHLATLAESVCSNFVADNHTSKASESVIKGITVNPVLSVSGRKRPFHQFMSSTAHQRSISLSDEHALANLPTITNQLDNELRVKLIELLGCSNAPVPLYLPTCHEPFVGAGPPDQQQQLIEYHDRLLAASLSGSAAPAISTIHGGGRAPSFSSSTSLGALLLSRVDRSLSNPVPSAGQISAPDVSRLDLALIASLMN